MYNIRNFEEEFTIHTMSDAERDAMYDEFKKSYEKETGHAWDEGKFLSRAGNWEFFGTPKGGIAVRRQRSGMWKLVAVFGNPRDVINGFHELVSKHGNEPIWGAMTDKLANMLGRLSHGQFKVPPAIFVKTVIPYIKNVFGDMVERVEKDGALVINMQGIGVVKKYFVANKAYYRQILSKGMAQLKIPALIQKTLGALLKKLVA